MLTYKRLYQRIRETTGLDVLTPGTIQSIIENCDADLTGRGYRDFIEITIEPMRDKLESETDEEYEVAKKLMYENHGYGLYSFDIPEDMRRILYLKVANDFKMVQALRLSINSDRVNNLVVEKGSLRSSFTNIEQEALFYTNNNKIYLFIDISPCKLYLMFNEFYKNQLQFIIDELRRNPDSRRAVIDIRDNSDDMYSDDPACLQHIQFFIRDNKLHMKVLFRSNDACKAAFMNAFALIMIQKMVADVNLDDEIENVITVLEPEVKVINLSTFIIFALNVGAFLSIIFINILGACLAILLPKRFFFLNLPFSFFSVSFFLFCKDLKSIVSTIISLP